ncbi:BQ2448_2222 [Microbotryum intermedium]|uniref:BQ2448_2222 protein n=1 Tax=Microbotryum intermedium TaxID=269621 RepID=A0A238F5K4_9BASI|nr:BQ2448_2222 [Microbotryum intermedium]
MIAITALVMFVHMALFSSRAKGAVFRNVEMFSIIRDNAETFPAGDYSVQSVETGMYMTFIREDRVGLVLQDEYATLRMEQDAQYGDSGLTKGNWFGTVFSGCGMCASSQYGYPEGEGKIIAMVAYKCRAGESGKEIHAPIQIAKRELGDKRTNATFPEFYHLVGCSEKWKADSILEKAIELDGQEAEEAPTRRRSSCNGTAAKPEIRHRRKNTRLRHHRTFVPNGNQNGTQDFIIGKKRLQKRELKVKEGCYTIEDHLLDQRSRAIQSEQVLTYGTFVGVAMADLNSVSHIARKGSMTKWSC